MSKEDQQNGVRELRNRTFDLCTRNKLKPSCCIFIRNFCPLILNYPWQREQIEERLLTQKKTDHDDFPPSILAARRVMNDRI